MAKNKTHDGSMQVHNPTRLYLDTSAWVSLIKEEVQLLRLVDEYQSGIVEVILSETSLSELIINDEIGEQRRRSNLFSLLPFLSSLEFDVAILLDHSGLGIARLPSDKTVEILNRHLERKTQRLDASADAVHIANARAFRALLVSCDRQVRSSAMEQNFPIICLRTLILRFGWRITDLDSCSCG